MSSNKEKFLTTFEELKGQFVITASHRIERLVAIGDDGYDYYWVTFNGRELVWNTCVGRIMPLKGYLRDEDYLELIRLAKLNHYDQFINRDDAFEVMNKETVIQYRNKLLELDGGDRLLTNVCWDLN